MARVHKTGLIVAGVIGLSVAFYSGHAGWAAGFSLAAVWSVANFWMLERVIRLALRPGSRDKLAIAMALLVKLPLLQGLLALLVFKGNFAVSALGAGLSVPLLVIVLKIAGRMLVLRLRASGPELPEARS